MGKGRVIIEGSVKPHHKDKSYYVLVDGNPVSPVDLKHSREVRQEPVARRSQRPVGIEYVRPDGFSTRHRTESSRIKGDRVLNKGIQLHRHWFQFLKLALELQSLGENVEIVTRHGAFLSYKGGGRRYGESVGGRQFRQRDSVKVRVNEKKYEEWDLDEVLNNTFNKWWESHHHLFEGHYPTRLTSKEEWSDNPNFIYIRIDKTSRRPDVDSFIQTIKSEMSPEGSPHFQIDGFPRPDVLQNRYNALVMTLKGISPKEICEHKDIYLRATDDKNDGERLKVSVNSKGKSLYPIVLKQQRDGGVHHLLDVMQGSFGSVPQDRGFKQ